MFFRLLPTYVQFPLVVYRWQLENHGPTLNHPTYLPSWVPNSLIFLHSLPHRVLSVFRFSSWWVSNVALGNHTILAVPQSESLFLAHETSGTAFLLLYPRHLEHKAPRATMVGRQKRAGERMGLLRGQAWTWLVSLLFTPHWPCGSTQRQGRLTNTASPIDTGNRWGSPLWKTGC